MSTPANGTGAGAATPATTPAKGAQTTPTQQPQADKAPEAKTAEQPYRQLENRLRTLSHMHNLTAKRNTIIKQQEVLDTINIADDTLQIVIMDSNQREFRTSNVNLVRAAVDAMREYMNVTRAQTEQEIIAAAV
jgi:hypothetical protein